MAANKKAKKDYLEPWLAAAQLINCAVSNILCLKPGYRVRWNLSLNFTHDGTDDGSKVRLGGGTFSSKAPDPRPEVEKAPAA